MAHGPCEQTEPIRLSLPAGERRFVRRCGTMTERVVATGTAPVGAVVVMRADPQARGALWLWPHLGGVAGCDVLALIATTWRFGLGVSERSALSPAVKQGICCLIICGLDMADDGHGAQCRGVCLASSTSVRRIEPGQRRPAGEQPLRLDLTPAAQPQGRLEVGFRRLDDRIADCDQVGVDRLVIKARQLGSAREVEFSRACDEPLPEWSSLLSTPGSVDVLIEALQDEQILVSWGMDFTLCSHKSDAGWSWSRYDHWCF